MLKTERVRTAVACPDGHGFTASFLVSINVDKDPDLFFALNEDGSQLMVCPMCACTWSLAEPVAVHSVQKNLLVLMVPDALAHRVLDLRASALLSLKNADPELLTREMVQFTALSRRETESRLGKNEELSAERTESGLPRGIARAFADLSSIAPSPLRK